MSRRSKAIEKYLRNKELLSSIEEGSLPCGWRLHDTILYRTPREGYHSSKVMAIDFDNTLKHGGQRWELSSLRIPKALARFRHDQGFKLCIFTNQSSAGRMVDEQALVMDLHRLIRKFDSFLRWVDSSCRADLGVYVFAALARGDLPSGYDGYRKPEV
ncbi:hypothetical protein FOL46_001866, partial [Perkinsus olseni]